VGWSSVYSAS